MSDLDAPGMAEALAADAAKLIALGADPGPSFGGFVMTQSLI